MKVAPWWEIPDPILEVDYTEGERALGKECKDRGVKFGTLVQVGWLIENADGCFLGVGLGAKDYFEEVGGDETKRVCQKIQDK